MPSVSARPVTVCAMAQIVSKAHAHAHAQGTCFKAVSPGQFHLCQNTAD